MKATRWKWIRHEGQRLESIGVNDDGSLYNPNGYPADLLRAAIDGAVERRRGRRSAAAKKAAQTRRTRQERLVYDVARRIVAGEVFGPATGCFICHRGLGDPESIQRGIGSECWQGVLDGISDMCAEGMAG